MKYKKIYSKNNINQNSGTLYGIFHSLGEITLIKEGNTYYIKNNTIDSDFMFGEVDEYKLYKDVVEYGKKLYLLFKKDIGMKIYNSNDFDPYTRLWRPITIINSKHKIESSFNICKDFVEEYNLPLDTGFFAISRKAPCTYKNDFLKIINYLLITFMIHTIFIELSAGYNKYPEIYQALDIAPGLTNKEILNIIVKCHNSFRYIENENIGTYKLYIFEKRKNLIPIRYTNNLFTYVYEAITNNLCTLTFHHFDSYELENQYIVYRKCSGCLNNLSGKVTTQEQYKHIPIYKEIYCEECKLKSKRNSSTTYEQTLREKYNEIKNKRNDISSPELILEIDSMPPKDKITKRYLKELEEKIEKEKR